MAEKKENTITIELANKTATQALAQTVAEVARAGDVFALSGDLGSGKTVFARAFINARAESQQEVPSPTFTLVQEYEFSSNGGVIPVFHFDLFRIEEATEVRELGMDEAFAGGISLIEWPERINGHLPADRLEISLDQGPTENARRASLRGLGSWGPRIKKIRGVGDPNG